MVRIRDINLNEFEFKLFMEFDDYEFVDETTIQIMGQSINTALEWNKELYDKKKKDILKSNTNKIKGVLAEYIACIFLKENNYLVESYSKVITCIQYDELYHIELKRGTLGQKDKIIHEKIISGEYDGKGWNAWLGSNIYRKKFGEDYIELIKKYGSNFMVEIKKLYNIYNDYGLKNNSPRYIPDLIAIKDDKKYVVEVKSYTIRGKSLPKHQKESLELSKNVDFTPIIINIPINTELRITEGEPKILSI